MSNYRRAKIAGGVFFFTVVTHNRTPLFTNETRVETLRMALRDVINNRPFVIDAMVILPDHLHCIWRLPDGDSDFSGRWREIKKSVSKAVSVRPNEHCTQHVWQRRFWEHAIRNDKDWRRHVAYIHYNPVKHGYVTRPADWPWSSFARAVARGWHDSTWGESEPAEIKGLDFE